MIDVAILPHRPRSPQLLAEFDDPAAMVAATIALGRESYHDLETYTPYDVPDVDAPLGLARHSKLGLISAAGGVVGLICAYGIQWWANVHSYPLNAGGRPPHAAPAFVPATFEGTVAGAALAAFIAMFVLLRYPRPYAIEDEVPGFERATIDRFWIGVNAFGSERDREHAIEVVTHCGALRAVKVGTV